MSNKYFIKTIGKNRKPGNNSCQNCKFKKRGILEEPCARCLGKGHKWRAEFGSDKT